MLYGEYGTSNGTPENMPAKVAGSKPATATNLAPSEEHYRAEEADLQSLGFSKPMIASLKQKAVRNGSTLEAELLCEPLVDPELYYEALARQLKLPFVADVSHMDLAEVDRVETQLVSPRIARVVRSSATNGLLVVPSAGFLSPMRELFRVKDENPMPVCVTTPNALRQAVWKAGARRRVAATVFGLGRKHPTMSAQYALWGRQGFLLGLLSAGLLMSLISSPGPTLLYLHLFMSILYLFSLALRILAVSVKPARSKPKPMPDSPLPIYTVLVALYREEAVARQLVASLNRLNWPKSRLDIKLICEADDKETIAALKQMKLGYAFEIVEVPPMAPRTKPKALTYALPGVRGDYVVIYDAEDRPHPDQLREAYARFCNSPQTVACLQSPLKIHNSGTNWISALFALEYAGLFNGLLPLLAYFHLPLPLGGTSNHFRTQALKESCGWDPFNVTEDADLGIRLYRMGYHCGVLSLPTLEDAPVARSIWMGQRTRWFKGWMQTLLVHTRRPGLLFQQTGFLAAVTFLMTIGGGLVSSLAHPLIALLAAHGFWLLWQGHADTPMETILIMVDAANLTASYVVFALMGKSAYLSRQFPKHFLCFIPFYWMMMAYACWRALIELHVKPHHWQKTPHIPCSKLRTVPK